jgi:hypothetical protein
MSRDSTLDVLAGTRARLGSISDITNIVPLNKIVTAILQMARKK